MMNRTLIETNVILRYLLDDDEDMSLRAELIIEGGAWTTPEVLAEVTYVLESVYKVPRADIAAALDIAANHISLEPEQVYLDAISEYGATNLDFVDCMIVSYSKNSTSKVFSFDKGINRMLKHLLDERK